MFLDGGETTRGGLTKGLNFKGKERFEREDWDGGGSEKVKVSNFGDRGGEEKRNVEVGLVVMDFEKLDGGFGGSVRACFGVEALSGCLDRPPVEQNCEQGKESVECTRISILL